ncbi:hypothetical protein MASR2M17_17940 [Aminivibrio sp.]
MVLVAVGHDDADDLLPVLLEIGDVGDDEIDAEHLVVGKHEAAVNDEDGIPYSRAYMFFYLPSPPRGIYLSLFSFSCFFLAGVFSGFLNHVP